jgi:hypothetical protein
MATLTPIQNIALYASKVTTSSQQLSAIDLFALVGLAERSGEWHTLELLSELSRVERSIRDLHKAIAEAIKASDSNSTN